MKKTIGYNETIRVYSKRFITMIHRIQRTGEDGPRWPLHTVADHSNVDFGYWAGHIDTNWCYSRI